MLQRYEPWTLSSELRSFDFPRCLFRPLLVICFFCVSALFRYDMPSPNDEWQILVQSYQKLLLHSHTWVAWGEWFLENGTMMNHDEPWWTMKPWKELQDSIDENTKDIKRYCNWNTHVQHQKGHGVAPDGKTSQPRSPQSKGKLCCYPRWTDQHAEIKAKWRKKQTVAWEMTSGMGNDVRLHTSKSPPSSDLTWPKHLPHCEPSKGRFWSCFFSEYNLFKSPLVHFLRVSRHIPLED